MFSIETIMLQSKNGINIVIILYNNEQYTGLLVGAIKTQIPIPFEQQIFYAACHDKNGCHNRAWGLLSQSKKCQMNSFKRKRKMK